jgi:hypothetical protein
MRMIDITSTSWGGTIRIKLLLYFKNEFLLEMQELEVMWSAENTKGYTGQF